ncbi:MAG: class II fructose-bisphosphate aldolase [Nitrospirae bacterium]|nr:class II fructose-bisphosphate aldolase [Nitrospirota bacterium]
MIDVKKFINVIDGRIRVTDRNFLRESIDNLIYRAVFSQDDSEKTGLYKIILEAAKESGIYPSSIEKFYEDIGKGRYSGFTVPAINIRGLTYDVARTIFRKAKEKSVGAFIFEIARSEIGYTMQRPLEYSASVLSAAIKEGYEGPVFLQGDHFQVNSKRYAENPEKEIDALKSLIKEAVEAEFYNIDIDASTMVDLSKDTIKEQQEPNYTLTASLASYIRKIEPDYIPVSIGGEIGEIGGRNSTVDELGAFLDGFRESLEDGMKGLSKISVQTGTTHGGVVLPDGKLAKVKIDFETLKTLSEVARKEYGLSGAVQHGASTLPEEAFSKFPETGTAEIHLATGFQNIIYDHPSLPSGFKEEVYQFLSKEFHKERKEGQTEEQFIYSARKKGFGPLKKSWWSLPEDIKNPIMNELEDRFGLLFDRLNVRNTRDMVSEAVKVSPTWKEIPEVARRLL